MNSVDVLLVRLDSRLNNAKLMVVIATPVSQKKDTERSHILPDIKGKLLRVSNGTAIVHATGNSGTGLLV
jgi:hypothetical protein